MIREGGTLSSLWFHGSIGESGDFLNRNAERRNFISAMGLKIRGQGHEQSLHEEDSLLLKESAGQITSRPNERDRPNAQIDVPFFFLFSHARCAHSKREASIVYQEQNVALMCRVWIPSGISSQSFKFQWALRLRRAWHCNPAMKFLLFRWHWILLNTKLLNLISFE